MLRCKSNSHRYFFHVQFKNQKTAIFGRLSALSFVMLQERGWAESDFRLRRKQSQQLWKYNPNEMPFKLFELNEVSCSSVSEKNGMMWNMLLFSIYLNNSV